MNLTGFDYYSNAPDPSVGFTRTADLIRTARAQSERDGDLVLLFDNGDAFQGTPFGEWAAGQATGAHPMMQAFESLRYDAIGLGNHDFSFGLEKLDRIVRQARCPVLCSNARRVGAAQSWQHSTVLKRPVFFEGQKKTLRIGVLSVLPPQTAKWEAHRLENAVVVDDILATARTSAAGLLDRGCDLIVALAHSGIGTETAETGLENAVIPLAATDGIDAVIAGHSHLPFPGGAYENRPYVDSKTGRIHGKPVVLPGPAGAHLGVIDLSLHHDESQGWQILDSHVELRPIACPAQDRRDMGAREDPEMVRLFSSGHEQTCARMAEPVGHISQGFHSYFSFCIPDRGLAILAAAQAAALRPFLKDTLFEALPVLSAAAPAKFGGRAGPGSYTDVPAGEVCLRHISDLHVFPNEMRAIVVSGAQVRDWLEMSAGLFNQLKPDLPDDLTDHDRAGHNFDILHGLSYQIDLSRPPRFDVNGRLIDPAHSRIFRLCFDGQPVTPDQQFVVALNNYRASGGGYFPSLAQARSVDLPTLRIGDVLRHYLSGRSPRDPLEDAAPPFSLVASPGTRAILRTGPLAVKHMQELAEFDPQIQGHDPEGFLRLLLTL